MAVAISVKETQEIIRHVVAHSRQAISHPYTLNPLEAGMATGPRFRKRALLRPTPGPDYLNPGENTTEIWEKLDTDLYKFTSLRGDQLLRLRNPISHQFIFEVENSLKSLEPDYELGSYLGLVRMAADLDLTRKTYVTASERNSFHAFSRRLTIARKEGEHFEEGSVDQVRGLLASGKAPLHRGLADLLRLVARAMRVPLIGNLQDVNSMSVRVLLRVVEIASNFNQGASFDLEFQVSPMDVFLGARAILSNRSVITPSIPMLMDLVLNESGLYHEDLMDWLKNVGVFGSELTLHMPEQLCVDGHALGGGRVSSLELLAVGGMKLMNSVPGKDVGKFLGTLADAIVYKVQQQDCHKDVQVRTILQHFNRLLQTERRSAQRVTEQRQQARFDYLNAIKRANEVASEITATQIIPRIRPSDETAVAGDEASAGSETTMVAAVPVEAGHVPMDQDPAPIRAPDTKAIQILFPEDGEPEGRPFQTRKFTLEDYAFLLPEWDGIIFGIRRRLSSKSPVFKALVSQLARVRALDNCMLHSITPGGSRCVSRLMRLFQGEDVRLRLGFHPDNMHVLEEILGSNSPEFLSSLESLLLCIYDYPPNLPDIQFRMRDRNGAEGDSDGSDAKIKSPSELDESILGFVLQIILLSRRFNETEERGKNRYRPDKGVQSIQVQPFHYYCAFLWECRYQLGEAEAPIGQPDLCVSLLAGLPEEWKKGIFRRLDGWRAAGIGEKEVLPDLGDLDLRVEWYRGFERGFMEEIKMVAEGHEGDYELETALLGLLTELQGFLDKVTLRLERNKAEVVRERLSAMLDQE